MISKPQQSFPKIVAIIQARMGSSRLPGKVLLDVEGKTMLARVIERVQQAKALHQIVVATSVNSVDKSIVDECTSIQVPVFRGSEHDVLKRYGDAARDCKADVIVRITSDCPFLDPKYLDQVVYQFLEHHVDYASNGLIQPYPHGLDVEACTVRALERAEAEAIESYQRTHVTSYLYEHPELFKLLPVALPHEFAYERWTVDTPEDLNFARALYSRLRKFPVWGAYEILELLKQEPELRLLNSHIQQKNLFEG